MLDKDKLQVVVYLNVSTIPQDILDEHTNTVSENLNAENDGTIIYYIVPITTGEPTHFEFNWPPYRVKDTEVNLESNFIETLEKAVQENNIN